MVARTDIPPPYKLVSPYKFFNSRRTSSENQDAITRSCFGLPVMVKEDALELAASVWLIQPSSAIRPITQLRRPTAAACWRIG